MKSLFVSLLVISASTLAACQSSGVAQSETRTLELTSGQARTTVELPASDSVASGEAPYALQGIPSDAPAAPTSSGYQAR